MSLSESSPTAAQVASFSTHTPSWRTGPSSSGNSGSSSSKSGRLGVRLVRLVPLGAAGAQAGQDACRDPGAGAPAVPQAGRRFRGDALCTLSQAAEPAGA